MNIRSLAVVFASSAMLAACVEQPSGYGYRSGPAYGQQYSGGCNAPGSNTLIGVGGGALGGGLIGNLASGHRHKGRNTLLGALGGAALGGVVGASTEHPCPPPGYGAGYAQPSVYAAPYGGYQGSYGPPPPPPGQDMQNYGYTGYRPTYVAPQAYPSQPYQPAYGQDGYDGQGPIPLH